MHWAFAHSCRSEADNCLFNNTSSTTWVKVNLKTLLYCSAAENKYEDLEPTLQQANVKLKNGSSTDNNMARAKTAEFFTFGRTMWEGQKMTSSELTHNTAGQFLMGDQWLY